ncbi:unnamed protein product [Ilex paraguariensis]|uniref:Uncharacterized protein n=1 Tax=Ilex paraguariensis TaxID=185542 RepID=A0ABC8T3F6_9AQUA
MSEACKNNTHDTTQNQPEPKHSAGEQFPPDPLLGPGEFIDVDTGNRADQNGVVDHTEPNRVKPPDSSEPTTTTTATTPQRRRRAREDVAAMAERPAWLPDDWKIDMRIRSSGATAGLIDRLKR